MDNQNPEGYPGEEKHYKINDQRPGKLLKIMSVVIAVLLIAVIALVVGIFHMATSQPVGAIPHNPTPTSIASSQLTIQPTSIPTTPPTATSTTTSTTATPTSTPTSNASTALPFTLKCTCSDPIVVTVKSIKIEPQQNRMLWSLSFYNNSQVHDNPTFQSFTLQNGDQSQDPTASQGQTYKPTGPGIDHSVDLEAGATQNLTITYSFVPDKGMPYTLVSNLGSVCCNINFNPVVIYF